MTQMPTGPFIGASNLISTPWRNFLSPLTAISWNATSLSVTLGSTTVLTFGGTDWNAVYGHVFDTGSTDASGLQVQNSSAGVGGPSLSLYQNSASPAVSDTPGKINFVGNNSAAAIKSYGKVICTITDPTAASEDSTLQFQVRVAGGLVVPLSLNSGGAIKPAAGTSTLPPLLLQSGTNLTSAVAGALEYDGAQLYATLDTTSGRAAVPAEQYFHLTADGSTISTIANFFGTTSNISLVASGYYVIDIYLYYLKTTAGTVTWTLTNSAAPTAQNIYYEMSPITGIVAPPGTATMLVGQFSKDATAARTVVTGSLTTAVDHYAHFKIFLQNGTGTSLQIQATCSAGTITPRANSFWSCRRISPNNIGTFAA